MRAVFNWAADWVYAVLITFGWQPKAEREAPPEDEPTRM